MLETYSMQVIVATLAQFVCQCISMCVREQECAAISGAQATIQKPPTFTTLHLAIVSVFIALTESCICKNYTSHNCDFVSHSRLQYCSMHYCILTVTGNKVPFASNRSLNLIIAMLYLTVVTTSV